jgi:hypothetical protein
MKRNFPIVISIVSSSFFDPFLDIWTRCFAHAMMAKNLKMAEFFRQKGADIKPYIWDVEQSLQNPDNRLIEHAQGRTSLHYCAVEG